MSKFCANCGNMMNDTDMVCGACGMQYAAPAQAAAPVQNNAYDPYGAPVQNNAYNPYGAPAQNNGYVDPGYPAQPMAPAKNSVLKKYLPVGIGAIVAIVAIILVISVAGSSGYKKAIKTFLEAMYTGDEDMLAEDTSIIMTNGEDPDPDNYEYVLGILSESFEEEYGEFKSVKIKVTDVKKYDRDEIEEYCEDNASEVDPDDIKKLYEVDVEMTFKGSEDESDKDDDNEQTFIVSKEDGGWKIAGPSELNMDYSHILSEAFSDY